MSESREDCTQLSVKIFILFKKSKRSNEMTEARKQELRQLLTEALEQLGTRLS